MAAVIGNASKRWLNQLLTRIHGAVTGARAKSRSKQTGAIMLETLAAISAAGVVAGSALHFHTHAQRKALDTQVAMSASAFASALNMQQAAAALEKTTSGLALNSNGLVVATSDTRGVTDQGCETLWSALVLSATPSMAQQLNTSTGWRANARGESCVYTFSEQAVGARAFRYSSATGQVELLDS